MCERQCLGRHGDLFTQAVQRLSHFTSGLRLQLANVCTPSTSVCPRLFIGLAILVIIVSIFLTSFYHIFSSRLLLQYSHCGIIKNIFCSSPLKCCWEEKTKDGQIVDRVFTPSGSSGLRVCKPGSRLHPTSWGDQTQSSHSWTPSLTRIQLHSWQLLWSHFICT